MREGYKKTELGEIPVDWEVKKLGELCQNRTEKFNPINNENKMYIALEHMKQEEGRIYGYGDSEETTSIKSCFYKNDILFGKLRPYLKKYWYAKFDGVCATEILALKTNKGFSSIYNYYLIQQDKFIERLSAKSFGTKMPRTSWNEMKETLFPIPSLKEQQKIASILSTVDTQIDQTDKLIEKTKELKKGLMQKLLTKGIGHTEFKKTEVGEIPVEWEVKKLGEISELITKGTTPMTYGFCFVDEGINFIKIENISELGKLITDSFLKISKECYEKLSRSQIKYNDILVSIAGSLGKSAVVTKDILPANTNQALAIIRIKQEKYHVKYINRIISSEYFRKYVNRISTVGAQPNLSLKQVGDFKIPVPPLREQQKISSILSSVDEQIDQYTKKKEKLQELKKGLMQQMLTGKVRAVTRV